MLNKINMNKKNKNSTTTTATTTTNTGNSNSNNSTCRCDGNYYLDYTYEDMMKRPQEIINEMETLHLLNICLCVDDKSGSGNSTIGTLNTRANSINSSITLSETSIGSTSTTAVVTNTIGDTIISICEPSVVSNNIIGNEHGGIVYGGSRRGGIFNTKSCRSSDLLMAASGGIDSVLPSTGVIVDGAINDTTSSLTNSSRMNSDIVIGGIGVDVKSVIGNNSTIVGTYPGKSNAVSVTHEQRTSIDNSIGVIQNIDKIVPTPFRIIDVCHGMNNFTRSTTLLQNDISFTERLESAAPHTYLYKKICESTPIIAASILTQYLDVTEMNCSFMEPTMNQVSSFYIKHEKKPK